jgi:hypothetical protein
MDMGYELYCLADPRFYDSATILKVDERFPAVPAEFLAGAVRVTADARPPSPSPKGRTRSSPPPLEPDPIGWVLARESMAQASVPAATPHDDRSGDRYGGCAARAGRRAARRARRPSAPPGAWNSVVPTERPTAQNRT